MFIYSDFKKWLDTNDYLNKNFALMQEVVTEYLERAFEGSWEDVDMQALICRQIPTVLSRCDEITYNEPGVPEAYILIHFLDRYHRFQLIFMDMLKKGTFPIRETIDVMDVGTGPGPSLFALSDMILLINQYLGEKENSKGISVVNLDYVEQSEGFRQFMHHATEMIMAKGHESFVRFHFGTYRNAATFQSGEKRLVYVDAWKVMASPDEEDYFRAVPRYVPYKRSFDMVIYSNFLTNVNVVNMFQKQLKKTMFYLRNRGVMVIVGAKPTDPKYAPVYTQIDTILRSQKYTNYRYGGWYKKKASAEMMSYAADSKCNKVIQAFYSQMFNKMPRDEWDKMSEKTKKNLNSFMEGKDDTKWYVTIYKRYSYFRHKKHTRIDDIGAE